MATPTVKVLGLLNVGPLQRDTITELAKPLAEAYIANGHAILYKEGKAPDPMTKNEDQVPPEVKKNPPAPRPKKNPDAQTPKAKVSQPAEDKDVPESPEAKAPEAKSKEKESSEPVKEKS